MVDEKNNASPHSSVTSPRLRFGTFEVNLDVRELRKQGIRIKLPHKPFQVLELLLKKPGLLVRREELTQHLWPNLHVNFDSGLNTAVNTLREALGDSPKNCRFVETLPGLGYRFLMPVEVISHAEPTVENTDNRASDEIVSFEAKQDYLKGKFFYNKLNEDDLRKSIAYFESAIAQEPSFASAYAALADAYCLGALLGIMSPDDAHFKARKWILAALRINHESPDVRLSLAGIKRLFDRDWQGAEVECLRALQRNPDHAGIHQAYATLLAITDRVQEALTEIRRAQILDPLSLVISTEMAGILYLAQDFSGAIEQAWKTLALDPRLPVAQHILGLAYEATGMMEEAIVEFQNSHLCSGQNPAAVAALGHTYSLVGHQEMAYQALWKLNEMSKQRYVSPYWKSVVYIGVDALDLALRALDECWQTRDILLFMLKIDSRLDPIRGHAQFGNLLTQLSLRASSP